MTSTGHITFVTNQLRTHFYAQIAARLRRNGVRVSWIATSPRWVEVGLKEAGVIEGDVLDLSREGDDWLEGREPTAEQLVLLSRIEQAGGLSIKDMLIMDRAHNRQPWRYGLAYAASLATRVNVFLTGRGVDLCLGETTWCGELLIAQLVRLHGATYAQPATLRIPSERFGLLEDVATDRLFEWRAPDERHQDKAKEIIANFDKSGVTPYYMATIPNPLKWRPYWTKEAIIALTGDAANGLDYTVPPLHIRAVRRLRFAWNAMRAKRYPFETGPSRPDAPYVFVTLHYQPEASVDVWGAPFNNQIEAIRALARLLPVDYEILVKEHRAAIGCRAPEVYEELSRIPGVRLIHFGCDTRTLMKGARLVASPAGTACYEAAVRSVPAVIFGRLFFGRALLKEAFDPYGMTREKMSAFLEEAERARQTGELKDRAQRFLATALANSFDGRYGATNDPGSMTSENLDLCSEGLLEALGHLRVRATPQS